MQWIQRDLEHPLKCSWAWCFTQASTNKRTPRVWMKLLIDFCVSQLIALLGMTTAGKFVFSIHIYSSRKFLFWSSNTSLTLIFFVGHLANLFVNPFTYSRYTHPCLPSTEPTMSPSPRQPRKHTKQRFDFKICFLWIDIRTILRATSVIIIASENDLVNWISGCHHWCALRMVRIKMLILSRWNWNVYMMSYV